MDQKNTLENAYRYYYASNEITPKEMANLICDNDLREKKSLKYANPNFKNTCQRIRDAVSRGDIKLNSKYTVNSKFDSKILFQWAIKEFPKFHKKLPPELIPNTISVNCILPPLTVSGSCISIPTNPKELQQQFVQISHENIELKEKNHLLELEIQRLSVFENKKIAKINDSRTGGKNSKGKPKHY